jgi:hypothetical protein
MLSNFIPESEKRKELSKTLIVRKMRSNFAPPSRTPVFPLMSH